MDLRQAHLNQTNVEIEAGARVMALGLSRVFDALVDEIVWEMLGEANLQKIRNSRLLTQANRIISEQARGLFGRAASRTGLRPAIDLQDTPAARDFAERLERLQEQMRSSIGRKATRELMRVLEQRREKPRRELAQEMADRLRGDMTFDRSLTWARTEAAVATNTGTAAAYEAAGVERIEWIAFKSPIWPRRHDRLDNVVHVRGDPYTMPVSGARLRWPHDPLGPVGEVVNCRCSIRAVRPKRGPGRPPGPPKPQKPNVSARRVQEPFGTEDPDPTGPGRPTQTTDYDPAKLTEALGQELRRTGTFSQTSFQGQRTFPTERQDRTEARRQVQSLLDRRGLRSRMRTRETSMTFDTDRTLDDFGVHGFIHPSRGEPVYSSATKNRLLRFADGDRSRDALEGFHTMIHEELHTTGPTFTGNIVLEEATTELAARRIVQDEVGAENFPDYSGAYHGYLRQVDEVLDRTTNTKGMELEGRAAARVIATRAALRMKTMTGGSLESAFTEALLTELRLAGIPFKRSALENQLRKLDPEKI